MKVGVAQVVSLVVGEAVFGRVTPAHTLDTN
jgi:hypothetical protein